MNPSEVIARKRDGEILSEKEIHWFIRQFMAEQITDYQLSALLMAIYLQGMTAEETHALTGAYIESGSTIDLSNIVGPKIDKHSTGGVGDKVSIILAPLVASLGINVPMMSGRGLGHSGGTLDKLESIPGFNTSLTETEFLALVENHGLALIGQTDSLVPADKRIYALRDVTATVDCIPLICASIMSKKIAEGIDGLVLDVKYGNGAFMKSLESARELADSLIAIGQQADKRVTAVITSMDQPLGYKIGNWLEIAECIECLNGGGPEDLMSVTYALCEEMVVLTGETDRKSIREKLTDAIQSGKALAKFMEIVSAQNGDTSVIENPHSYPQADIQAPLHASQDGYVHSIDTYQVGMASLELGAGRKHTDDIIDPRAGLVLHKKVGDSVSKGDLLLEMHTEQKHRLSPALTRLESAIAISGQAPQNTPLIEDVVYGS